MFCEMEHFNASGKRGTTHMNKIKIGGIEKALSETSEQWISEQIRNRRQAGEPVCVQVWIQADGVDLYLSTPQCAGTGGGGGRMPNTAESELIKRWNDRHLGQGEWSVGNLIAFLKQSRLI